MADRLHGVRLRRQTAGLGLIRLLFLVLPHELVGIETQKSGVRPQIGTVVRPTRQFAQRLAFEGLQIALRQPRLFGNVVK